VKATIACARKSAGVRGAPCFSKYDWRGDEHAAHFAELHRRERAVGQISDAHGDVHALLDELNGAVEEDQADVETRMARQQLGDDRHDVQPSQHLAGGHHQQSMRVRGLSRGAEFGVAQVREDASAAHKEHRALLGQPHRAGRAVKQFNPQPFLKPLRPRASWRAATTGERAQPRRNCLDRRWRRKRRATPDDPPIVPFLE
jgi:hypothetical protein